jgi:hypothetical protein
MEKNYNYQAEMAHDRKLAKKQYMTSDLQIPKEGYMRYDT